MGGQKRRLRACTWYWAPPPHGRMRWVPSFGKSSRTWLLLGAGTLGHKFKNPGSLNDKLFLIFLIFDLFSFFHLQKHGIAL